MALINLEAEEAEAEADEFRSTAWAVNLADLMTFLMIFFLIMFSLYMTASKSATGQADVEAALKSIEESFNKRAAPHMIVVPKKKIDYKQKRVIQPKADEIRFMTAISAVQLTKPIQYPYGKTLYKKDLQNILATAKMDLAQRKKNYVAQIPPLKLNEDEKATFYLTEIILPMNVIVTKTMTFTYTAKKGDTWLGIMRKLNIDPVKAQKYIHGINILENRAAPYPGQKILIQKQARPQ